MLRHRMRRWYLGSRVTVEWDFPAWRGNGGLWAGVGFSRSFTFGGGIFWLKVGKLALNLDTRPWEPELVEEGAL